MAKIKVLHTIANVHTKKKKSLFNLDVINEKVERYNKEIVNYIARTKWAVLCEVASPV